MTTQIDTKLISIETKYVANLMKLSNEAKTYEEKATFAHQIIEYMIEPREMLKYSTWKATLNERVNYWNHLYPKEGFDKYIDTFTD
jgi:hypothetical protein